MDAQPPQQQQPEIIAALMEAMADPERWYASLSAREIEALEVVHAYIMRRKREKQ